MFLAGDRLIEAHNRITDPGSATPGVGAGILLQAGSANVFAHNTIRRSDDAGIRVAPIAAFPMGGTISNRFDANVVRDAGADGIAIGPPPEDGSFSDTVLTRNIVIAAAADGIDVEAPSTTLARNLAFRNADLGIEAVPEVIDGGGNTAFRNGNPAQCVGVLCRDRAGAKRRADAGGPHSAR